MKLESMDPLYISLESVSSMAALVWSVRISSDGFFVAICGLLLPRSVHVIAKV